MKLDLLTNATVVDDAIRFVSQKSKDKENLKAHYSSSGDGNVSNDYNEDKDQLEEEQDDETGEIIAATTKFF